jgi:8-oxo-dGTP pyrophosphatase MutT (NUDIX family)
LIIQERKHGELWYLPGGGLKPGESFYDAVARETLEESGIPIVPEGIVRVEHTMRADTARCRVIFVARPGDDSLPKQSADDESLQAAWVTLDELEGYPLRGPEVRDLFDYVASGRPVFPLQVLVPEYAPLG